MVYSPILNQKMAGAVSINLVPYVKPSSDRLIVSKSIYLEYNILINANLYACIFLPNRTFSTEP